jgi:hypothetical protein
VKTPFRRRCDGSLRPCDVRRMHPISSGDGNGNVHQLATEFSRVPAPLVIDTNVTIYECALPFIRLLELVPRVCPCEPGCRHHACGRWS